MDNWKQGAILNQRLTKTFLTTRRYIFRMVSLLLKQCSHSYSEIHYLQKQPEVLDYLKDWLYHLDVPNLYYQRNESCYSWKGRERGKVTATLNPYIVPFPNSNSARLPLHCPSYAHRLDLMILWQNKPSILSFSFIKTKYPLKKKTTIIHYSKKKIVSWMQEISTLKLKRECLQNFSQITFWRKKEH